MSNYDPPAFATVGPAAASAQAQLLFALLVLALFASLALLGIPPRTDAVRLDFLGWASDGRSEAWASPAPPSRDFVPGTIYEPTPFSPLPSNQRHRLNVEPPGVLLLDGCAIDLVTLRTYLELFEASGQGWIDMRPDPEAPYEEVATVFAVFARAHVTRFRLDSRPFEKAIDRKGRLGMAKAQRKPPQACPPRPPDVD